jgi:hypothetical protein
MTKRVFINGEEVVPGKKEKLYNKLTKKEIEDLILKIKNNK